MPRPRFDIGIIVALSEEFGYITELLPAVEPIQFEGTYLYRLDLSPVSAICCVAGQMGTLPASSAAHRLLRFAEINVLVLVGVAGAIASDVEVGDVVVAEEVDEYQASAKAEPTSDGYEVRYSGRHQSLNYSIKESIRHFRHACPDGFSKWQAEVSRDFNAIDVPHRRSVCSPPAALHLGPIASGNTVAASRVFVNEVRQINRKFLAIDMESAGVAFTASERVDPVRWLVVRGVSDRAR